jgi:hypothetical protein
MLAPAGPEEKKNKKKKQTLQIAYYSAFASDIINKKIHYELPDALHVQIRVIIRTGCGIDCA